MRSALRRIVQDEQSAPLPVTAYGNSKRVAEHLVRAWVEADSRRSALILRPCVIYGPGNKGNVYALVKAIDDGRCLLVGQNTNIKSLVSLRNVTASVTFLLSRMRAGCEIYNLVDKESYSVRKLAEMIANRLGRNRRSACRAVGESRGARRDLLLL